MLIFVGLCPSADSDPHEPLTGRSGSRLRKLLGASDAEWRSLARVNLIPYHQPTPTLPLAREWAATRWPLLYGNDVVVLGSIAAGAFGLEGELLTWQELNGARMVQVPHPSSLNHWWNDPQNTERATRLLRALARTYLNGGRSRASG